MNLKTGRRYLLRKNRVLNLMDYRAWKIISQTIHHISARPVRGHLLMWKSIKFVAFVKSTVLMETKYKHLYRSARLHGSNENITR